MGLGNRIVKRMIADADYIEELERELAATQAVIKVLDEAINEAVKEEYKASQRACDILYRAQKHIEMEYTALGEYVGKETVLLRKRIEGLENAINEYEKELSECKENLKSARKYSLFR